MADFNPGEDIPLDDFDDHLDFDWDYEEDTSFIDENISRQASEHFANPPGTDLGTEIRNAENLKAKEGFYQHIKDLGWEVDLNAALEHGITFEKDPKTKHIYAKFRDAKNKPRVVQLTNSRNPNQFLALSTIAVNTSVAFVRDALGVKGFSSGVKPKIPPEQRQTLNEVRHGVDVADQPEEIEMQNIEEVEEKLEEFLEAGTQTEQKLGPEDSLHYRELASLDRSLRNMRTSVKHLIGEREVKKERIRNLKAGMSEDETPADFEETRKEIERLEEETKLLDSEIREYDGKFRSQFERIKQTVDKMLNEDMTLGEKIRTLFREQGITIASIITALGLAITALVEGILLGGKSAVKPSPQPHPKPDPKPPKPGPSPTPEPGVKGWFKKIANLLLKLADKMLVALPGIIGSIVSFVLKSASAAVGFIAEHLWILVIALGGIMYNYVMTLKSKLK